MKNRLPPLQESKGCFFEHFLFFRAFTQWQTR